MSDLISRSALIKAMEKKYEVAEKRGLYAVGLDCGFIVTEGIINEQPTVEAVPVVHGEWMEASMNYKCSHCKTEFHDDIEWIQGCNHKLPNFCPECGAKMNGKKVQE